MSNKPKAKATYINPVHNRACADPYVLKYLNEYWCYCTGIWHDGRCFGVLHSRDLIHWRELGGAMTRLNDAATCYWAPEVIYDNGRFLMYYSVGNEENMQIRVSLADHPAGPFIDADRALTTEQFAIDPHVFRDTDGKWYLFYATDFLEHTHIGTGTVCDAMLDAFTLAGNPQPVTRAQFDWQVYDPERAEKGGVRWHTVEGPFVLKHKGKYYQMFSGGNWKNNTYGASYAVSDRVLRGAEWEQLADGEHILPILRTIPNRVVGPGHNSVTRGLNNVELYCVYHRWGQDNGDRVLAIDRIGWAGERMFVIGATTTPQPVPNPATVVDYFDTERELDSNTNWLCSGGKWVMQGGVAVQEINSGYAEARYQFNAAYFIAEVSTRLLPRTERQGAFGMALIEMDKAALIFRFLPERGEAIIEWRLQASDDNHWLKQNFQLPEDFDFQAFHLLRAEVNGCYTRILLDETTVEWEGKLGVQAQSFALWTEDTAAAFAGFSLTHGWQDLFMGQYTSPFTFNWDIDPADETWVIHDHELCHDNPQKVGSVLTKGLLPENYEFIVSAKLCSQADTEKCYGFLPAISVNNLGPLLTINREDTNWVLRSDRQAQPQIFRLPPNFDPHNYQQFRFRKEEKVLTIQVEAQIIAEMEVLASPIRVGLYCSEVIAAFDQVIVTAI